MEILAIDFSDSLHKLENFKITDLRTFDGFLYDVADIVFSLQEIIDEGYNNLSNQERKIYTERLNHILMQMKTFDKLLYQMDYDSHAYDRFMSVFHVLWKDIEKQVEELK